MGQRVIVFDDDLRPIRLDAATGALEVISYAHHEIHSGSSYSISESETSKNDGTFTDVYVKTPNTTKWGHMVFSWSSSGAAYGRILEAPTVTANTGTNAKVIYNHNRNSTNTSGFLDNATTPAAGKYCLNPTVTVVGTTIWEEYAGSGKLQETGDRGTKEFILKQNTAYVFRVESDSAGLTLSVGLDWYEHTNRY